MDGAEPNALSREIKFDGHRDSNDARASVTPPTLQCETRDQERDKKSVGQRLGE